MGVLDVDDEAASEVEEDASKKDKEGRMTTNKVRFFVFCVVENSAMVLSFRRFWIWIVGDGSGFFFRSVPSRFILLRLTPCSSVLHRIASHRMADMT